jgi:hypothetical protein
MLCAGSGEHSSNRHFKKMSIVIVSRYCPHTFMFAICKEKKKKMIEKRLVELLD